MRRETIGEDSDINLIYKQLDLMRLRRKIDSRIEPHPFSEKDFDITNLLVNEIVKYGQDIAINVASLPGMRFVWQSII